MKWIEENPEEAEIYVSLDEADYRTRPEITLLVNGKPMLFLVDSGAERTVLRNVKGIPKSQKTVRVVSASNDISPVPISTPVLFSLLDGSKATQCEVILSERCPHNLLGRELVIVLGITIKPGLDGKLKVETDQAESFVVESGGPPIFWWSLDLPHPSLGGTASFILQKAKERTRPPLNAMKPEQLHVTMRYSRQGGPDSGYDEAVHRIGPQSAVLTYMYWKDQTSFCTVDLSSAATDLMTHPQRAHMSLTKSPYLDWSNLGQELDRVKRINNWQPCTVSQIEWNEHSGWFREKLNYRVILEPTTHMTDEQDPCRV